MTTFKYYLAEKADIQVHPAAFRPTEHQRDVLSKVQVADSPELAADQVSRGQHFVEARDILIRLGFLEVVDGGLVLSSTGEDLVAAQGLEDPEFDNDGTDDPLTDVTPHTDNI